MTGKELAAVVIQPTNQNQVIRVATDGLSVGFASLKGRSSGAIDLIPEETLYRRHDVERLIDDAVDRAKAEWEASRPPAQVPADTGWIEVQSADSTDDVTMLVNLNGCTAVTMPIGEGRIILQLATGETVPVVATEQLKARVRRILGAVVS